MHRATDSKKDIKSKLKFRSTRLRVRDVAFLMVPHIQLNDTYHTNWFKYLKEVDKANDIFSRQRIHICESSLSTFWETQEQHSLTSRFSNAFIFCSTNKSQGRVKSVCVLSQVFSPGENLLFFRLRESSGREVGGLSKSIVTAATKRCLTCLTSS